MSTETFLRTGEVAARLGTSRQHVVDLCEQGRIPFITVGTHRRISERAVRELTTEGYTNGGADKRQSRWLHAALVSHLVSDPATVITKALHNIAQGRETGAIDEHNDRYFREWESILDGGVSRVIDALLDQSDHADTLRSCSPFAGVLPQEEARGIKRACRDERDRARST